MRLIVSIAAIAAAALISGPVHGQTNVAPTVDAGKDSTIQLPSFDLDYSLWGSVKDDGLPDGATLSRLWNKVSGPDVGLAVSYLDAPKSAIDITGIGEYVYCLTGSDGEFTVTDTVIITIIDSLPFTVLTPEEGDTVFLGDTCLITWQYNRPDEDLVIELSIDNGVIFESLLEEGQAHIIGNSLEWAVSDTLPESSACLIKVKRYRNSSRYDLSDAFTLAKKSGNVRWHVRNRLPGSGIDAGHEL